MKQLKELGYLETGMVLIDENGNEGTVTRIAGDPLDDEFTLVELNGSKTQVIWNWGRLKDSVYVKEGTY